ncbi:MAG: TonB-dependent receptor [Pacificimonas sp.]|jgi:hypothetical protein|nr:TonB-dependent receptor [Pacificimonas sp.]
MGLSTFLCCGVASAALLAAPAAAQDTEAAVDARADAALSPAEDTALAAERDAGGQKRRIYTPEDFTQFAPRNALDMVRQIPGFSISGSDQRRGLGQADTNVLINGERISGKSNGPVDALSRIPSGNVIRLEIVDGASLDVPGLSGQVLNAVTSSGGISGQFRYTGQFRSRVTEPLLTDGEISVAGGDERTDWNVSFEGDGFRGGADGTELVTDGAGFLIDTRDEVGRFYGDRTILAGAFTRRAENGNILNLNGEGQLYWFRGNEKSLQSGTLDVDRDQQFFEDEDEYNYEVGGDYEFGLLGGRLKLIGLRRYENSAFDFGLDIAFADGRPLEGNRFERQANEAETILRGEYGWSMLGGEWQLSLEGAENILDIDSAFRERDAAGVLVDVALPGASDRVEEQRAESLLTQSRPLSDALQLQLTGGVEYSEITQTGPLGQVRSFWRPKGSAGIDWNASEGLDISARLAREVGQLNFFDFIASVDILDEQQDVTNANLEPTESWVLEVEAAQNLGVFGSATLTLIAERIEGIIDQIPIADGGQAPGNAGDAEIYGAELNLTLLSEGFGWAGTRLEFNGEITESSVNDPLTGLARPISGEEEYEVDLELRHDFAGGDWAAGANLYYDQQSPFERLDERLIFVNQLFTEAFVEHKDVMGLTVRALVGNLTGKQENLFRTIFSDKSNRNVLRSEDRIRGFGTIFTLTVEGSF